MRDSASFEPFKIGECYGAGISENSQTLKCSRKAEASRNSASDLMVEGVGLAIRMKAFNQ